MSRGCLIQLLLAVADTVVLPVCCSIIQTEAIVVSFEYYEPFQSTGE